MSRKMCLSYRVFQKVFLKKMDSGEWKMYVDMSWWRDDY